MADIKQIKTSDGTVYNLKDASARDIILNTVFYSSPTISVSNWVGSGPYTYEYLTSNGAYLNGYETYFVVGVNSYNDRETTKKEICKCKVRVASVSGTTERSVITFKCDTKPSITLSLNILIARRYTGSSAPGLTQMIDALPYAPDSSSVTTITATLLASSWYNDQIEVYATGMTSSSNGSVGISSSATAAQREAARNACLSVTGQGTNTVTITADAGAPSVDIPIIITIFN